MRRAVATAAVAGRRRSSATAMDPLLPGNGDGPAVWLEHIKELKASGVTVEDVARVLKVERPKLSKARLKRPNQILLLSEPVASGVVGKVFHHYAVGFVTVPRKGMFGGGSGKKIQIIEITGGPPRRKGATMVEEALRRWREADVRWDETPHAVTDVFTADGDRGVRIRHDPVWNKPRTMRVEASISRGDPGFDEALGRAAYGWGVWRCLLEWMGGVRPGVLAHNGDERPLYHPLSRQCEHFARFIVLDEWSSPQVEQTIEAARTAYAAAREYASKNPGKAIDMALASALLVGSAGAAWLAKTRREKAAKNKSRS